MEQYFSAEDLAFREEVRDFLRASVSSELAAHVRAQQHLSKVVLSRWQKTLFDRGWAAPSWPKEYGGTGWTPMQRYIFEEACIWADAPRPSPFGLSMIGPVLYTFGTREQKTRYLPKILQGSESWCQGYSEPEAGSDLAALRTRAVPDGLEYVVNGSKIWTSQAHFADMMFCLVRTDPEAKAQKGISFLLVDMQTPGIEVRPIISLEGAHTLNEVFFRDVRVPIANVVGAENEGWKCAKFLLGHERISQADIAPSKKRLAMIKVIAERHKRNGLRISSGRNFAASVAGIEIELLALELTSLRAIAGEQIPAGPGHSVLPSILKLKGSEILQRLTEHAVEALGYEGLAYGPRSDGSHGTAQTPDYALGTMDDYLFRRAATIYAGSSETQRNIIARAIFGS